MPFQGQVLFGLVGNGSPRKIPSLDSLCPVRIYSDAAGNGRLLGITFFDEKGAMRITPC